MKRNTAISAILASLTLFIVAGTAWSVCPEDSYDRGICDTMYVEPWPGDIPLSGSPPHFIRVPIYVTCDVVNSLDSIIGFTIPLCYTHTEPSLYCSVSSWWNAATALIPTLPEFDQNRSIFRHLPSMQDIQIRNRMLDMNSDFVSGWDFIVVDLDDQVSAFWLSLVPTSPADQRWAGGSRVLLATMTIKLEADMQVCIDTCLWPPTSHLAWGILDDEGSSWTKVPRSGTGTNVYGGCFNTSEVRETQTSEENRPSGFSLSQNYPNPFNPVTDFEFSLSTSAHVRIDVFNILGQKLVTLVDEVMKPGVYLADWDGKDEQGTPVSSGIYFYRMQAGDFSEMKKMVLLK